MQELIEMNEPCIIFLKESRHGRKGSRLLGPGPLRVVNPNKEDSTHAGVSYAVGRDRRFPDG